MVNSTVINAIGATDALDFETPITRDCEPTVLHLLPYVDVECSYLHIDSVEHP